jgi:hypothetical protein
MKTVINTSTSYCLNICIWLDGTLRPMKGHRGNCRWLFDGQIHYHAPLAPTKEVKE